MLITEMIETCGGCPTIFDLKFSDNTEGYIKYRWGYLCLMKEREKGHNVEILGEQIGDSFDGIISKDDVIDWLNKNEIVVL